MVLFYSKLLLYFIHSIFYKFQINSELIYSLSTYSTHVKMKQEEEKRIV